MTTIYVPPLPVTAVPISAGKYSHVHTAYAGTAMFAGGSAGLVQWQNTWPEWLGKQGAAGVRLLPGLLPLRADSNNDGSVSSGGAAPASPPQPPVTGLNMVLTAPGTYSVAATVAWTNTPVVVAGNPAAATGSIFAESAIAGQPATAVPVYSSLNWQAFEGATYGTGRPVGPAMTTTTSALATYSSVSNMFVGAGGGVQTNSCFVTVTAVVSVPDNAQVAVDLQSLCSKDMPLAKTIVPLVYSVVVTPLPAGATPMLAGAGIAKPPAASAPSSYKPSCASTPCKVNQAIVLGVGIPAAVLLVFAVVVAIYLLVRDAQR